MSIYQYLNEMQQQPQMAGFGVGQNPYLMPYNPNTPLNLQVPQTQQPVIGQPNLPLQTLPYPAPTPTGVDPMGVDPMGTLASLQQPVLGSAQTNVQSPDFATQQPTTLEQYLAQQGQSQLQTPADYGINPYDRPIAAPSAPGVEQYLYQQSAQAPQSNPVEAYLQQQAGATTQAPTATTPAAPATGVEAYLQGQQTGTVAPTAQSAAPSQVSSFMKSRMDKMKQDLQDFRARAEQERLRKEQERLQSAQSTGTGVPGSANLQQLTPEQRQYLNNIHRSGADRWVDPAYRRYDPMEGIPFEEWKTAREASIAQNKQEAEERQAAMQAAKLAAMQAQQGTFGEMTTGVLASGTPLAYYSDPSKVPAGQTLQKLSEVAWFGGGWTGKTSNDALKNFVRSPEFLNNYNAYDLAKFGDLQKYIKDRAVVRSGGKVFMTEDQLNKAMSNLIPLPDQRLAQMAPLLGDLKNTGTYQGVKVYDKSELARQMMNYYTPSAEQLAANPALANLTPIAQLDGKNYYDVKQVNQILTPTLMNNLYQEYGYNPQQYVNPAVKGYTKGAIPDNNAYTLSQIANGKSVSWDNFKLSFNDAGRILGDNDGAKELKKVFNPVFMTTYHKDLMEGYGGALGLQPEEVKAVAQMMTGKLIKDANGNAPYYIGGKDYIGKTSGQYLNALWDYAEQKYGKPVNNQLKQQAQQAAVKLDTGLQKMRKYNKPDDNGGGILGKVFDFIDPILDNYTIHGQLGWRDKIQEATAVDLLGFDSPRSAFTVIMPMIVDGFFPGVGGLLNAAQSASVGDNTGIATGLISSYLGFSGGTGGVPLTDSSYVNSAITNAALTAGSAAAQGAEWDQALVAALLSGVGAYGADYIKAVSALNDWGAFGTGAAQAALKGGLSAANTANKGGNSDQIINSGLTGAAGSAAGSVVGGLGQMVNNATGANVTGGLNQVAQVGLPLAGMALNNYQRNN